MAQSADRIHGPAGERVPEKDRGAGDGEDARRTGGDGGVGVTHIPGTSFRVLPDGSVARFITSPGSLLDYAVRLQGAVGTVRAFADHADPHTIIAAKTTIPSTNHRSSHPALLISAAPRTPGTCGCPLSGPARTRAQTPHSSRAS